MDTHLVPSTGRWRPPAPPAALPIPHPPHTPLPQGSAYRTAPLPHTGGPLQLPGLAGPAPFPTLPHAFTTTCPHPTVYLPAVPIVADSCLQTWDGSCRLPWHFPALDCRHCLVVDWLPTSCLPTMWTWPTKADPAHTLPAVPHTLRPVHQQGACLAIQGPHTHTILT